MVLFDNSPPATPYGNGVTIKGVKSTSLWSLFFPTRVFCHVWLVTSHHWSFLWRWWKGGNRNVLFEENVTSVGRTMRISVRHLNMENKTIVKEWSANTFLRMWTRMCSVMRLNSSALWTEHAVRHATARWRWVGQCTWSNYRRENISVPPLYLSTYQLQQAQWQQTKQCPRVYSLVGVRWLVTNWLSETVNGCDFFFGQSFRQRKPFGAT